nr:UDP-glucose/GDP-mannose dehydrogenase family protein [uncultured Desulfobacter sp.]
MRISVFGLGYVGCVSAACLAKQGHYVVGVDISQTKVDIINQGKSPIIEKGLDILLGDVVGSKNGGTLYATTDADTAVMDTEISLICVGTPSNENGSLRLDYVKRCASNIGKSLKSKKDYHVVVARSTMLPGSVEDVIIKEIEDISDKKAGLDFGAAMNPEFLRESTSIEDFYNPPVTVIGQIDDRTGDLLEKMYAFLDAPVVRTDIKTAEMVKYANNTYHALKVCFANEIGVICKALGIDSHQVMDIFCMDSKLNLSPYYLKPGFAFGGSCLPKDLRAITYKAKNLDIDAPMLDSIMKTNIAHINRVINQIVKTGSKKIGILGLSFKAGTDDLRESPIVILTEALIGKGFDIKIYDKNVSLASLFGANKEYIEKEIPHISSLMTDNLDTVLSHAEVVVIGNKANEFTKAVNAMGKNKKIIDLVRIQNNLDGLPDMYDGICW